MKHPDVERRLDYNRAGVPQETGWWCGPASVQIALQAKGIHVPESQIAHDIEQLENPGRGDDKDGTDYIGLIETYLDRKVPHAQYKSVTMPNDPPTSAQVDRLFNDVVRSIDAGWVVVANIVAPPSNPPAAMASMNSKPPPYPRGLTTYHYLCLAGYVRRQGVRGFWVADPANFGGISGWWCPLEGKGGMASLIPPKGYCYSEAAPVAPPAQPPAQPKPPEIVGAVDLSGRPWHPSKADDMFGHVLSARSEGLLTQALLVALCEANGVDVQSIYEEVRDAL